MMYCVSLFACHVISTQMIMTCFFSFLCSVRSMLPVALVDADVGLHMTAEIAELKVLLHVVC